MRDGDRQIDTAHLLRSLLEPEADVRAAVGDGAQVARVLGYLVQRSIGYGLRRQGSVEDSGTLFPQAPGTASLGTASLGTASLGWSPSAVAAMAGALGRARIRGDLRATASTCWPASPLIPGAGPSTSCAARASTRRSSARGSRQRLDMCHGGDGPDAP
ncbi:hypothetical protein [Streptomyces sp. ISL-10]|uniref:hypothetical protein n=1 Tax=Streptomyces sp. ISL-10 TaxID=2819172 RepID=UPI0035ABE23A